MMNKKYKLCEDDTIVRDGRKLYRIEALRDVRFGVEAGEKGGYVESEANLSQEGRCWVYDNACAYEDARVEGYSVMYYDATLRGKAKLIDGATLWGHAIVEGEATVGGSANIQDYAVVGGKAMLKGSVCLINEVQVGGNAYLEGTNPRELILQGTTMILGNTVIVGLGVFPEAEAILEAGSFRVEDDD